MLPLERTQGSHIWWGEGVYLFRLDIFIRQQKLTWPLAVLRAWKLKDWIAMNIMTGVEPNLAALKQIGSFSLSNECRDFAVKALNIAQKMRVEGDGYAEDATRAFILMAGADSFPRISKKDLSAIDAADLDRQMVAYMDGISELMR